MRPFGTGLPNLTKQNVLSVEKQQDYCDLVIVVCLEAAVSKFKIAKICLMKAACAWAKYEKNVEYLGRNIDPIQVSITSPRKSHNLATIVHQVSKYLHR
jgi:hypothetical protein